MSAKRLIEQLVEGTSMSDTVKKLGGILTRGTPSNPSAYATFKDEPAANKFYDAMTKAGGYNVDKPFKDGSSWEVHLDMMS